MSDFMEIDNCLINMSCLEAISNEKYERIVFHTKSGGVIKTNKYEYFYDWKKDFQTAKYELMNHIEKNWNSGTGGQGNKIVVECKCCKCEKCSSNEDVCESQGCVVNNDSGSGKPNDYDGVLEFCRKVFSYYDVRFLSSQKIYQALRNTGEYDTMGYGLPDIFDKAAVRYGILRKQSKQKYEFLLFEHENEK